MAYEETDAILDPQGRAWLLGGKIVLTQNGIASNSVAYLVNYRDNPASTFFSS